MPVSRSHDRGRRRAGFEGRNDPFLYPLRRRAIRLMGKLRVARVFRDDVGDPYLEEYGFPEAGRPHKRNIPDLRIRDPIERESLARDRIRIEKRALSSNKLDIIRGPFMDRAVVRRSQGIARSGYYVI